LSFAHTALSRIARVDRSEVAGSLWSFACFFCLLCGYYILRPLRDEMGVQGGVQNLPWLFSATFVTMLLTVPAFGFTAARLPRRRLVPWTYLLFIASIFAFYAAFASGIAPAVVARAFFIWVSVFNLFAVSLFWSLMADLFRPEQAGRLFGFISAGGSCGALVGPSLTAFLACSDSCSSWRSSSRGSAWGRRSHCCPRSDWWASSPSAWRRRCRY
jgi:AAA family ATP:ADP antiporter